MEHEILLKTEKLGFAYPNAARAALSDVELELPRGAFLLLCGPSGGGKTTLLRQLKPALAPHGTRCGRILFSGQPLELLDARDAAARIGFVQQQPDNQLVTDKVWHELAFGLESLGLETAVIRRRVAETAA
ncbi:MAG: ATP-binding cassette domain-containing protein, partial [Oscillospiraceae bacterium]|nr:ATP-binding cassette domain-containing protein [Oscillospiraceae bacterium]